MNEVQGWFNYWKLVLFKTGNGFLLVVATTFLAATDGVDIEAFTTTQKWRLFIFCLVAGLKVLESFFDQTIHKMEPRVTAETPAPTTTDTK